MKIEVIDLRKRFVEEKKGLLKCINRVLKKGNLILTSELQNFENSICKYTGAKYCLGVNSGTDALMMALWSSGISKGDEVITSPISFIASVSSIIHVGAKPVFVDVGDDLNINADLIESAITKKTKAIMPVHWTGRVCDMDKILKIAKKYNLIVIEDAAQSMGSYYKKKHAGTFGKISAFSTHPLKNLNALGDGGFIVTNNSKLAKYIRKIRNHGLKSRDELEYFGFVSRMDNIQAAILNFRLTKIKKIISKRRYNATYFYRKLNKQYIFSPPEKKHEFNTYHTFVIQVPNRDKLKKFLKSRNILTYVHYPIPIHKQKAYRKMNFETLLLPVTELQSKQILSIPVHHNLTKKQLKYIVDTVNSFYK